MIDCIELSTSYHRRECNIDTNPLRLSCFPFHFVPGLSKQSKSDKSLCHRIFCCKAIDQIAKKLLKVSCECLSFI